MKISNESETEVIIVNGVRGHIQIRNFLESPLTMGVRVIPPYSDVPKPKHTHYEAQIIYVISGRASITNGVDTRDIAPGDYILLQPYEEHYVRTGSEELKIFEAKYTA